MAGPCTGHSKHFAASSKLAAILRLFKPWKWRRKKVGYTAPALTCEPATTPTIDPPTITCEPSTPPQSTLPLTCEPEPLMQSSATISKNSTTAKIVNASFYDETDDDEQKGRCLFFIMEFVPLSI